jgi:putative hydrolase of the HAD superfamily
MEPTLRYVLFDWGDTLMAECGPDDVPMADWPVVRAIEGAPETLARLAGSLTLAVCTNAAVSSRSDVERALARVGLHRFISAIFCRHDLQLRKESPEFWQTVLTQLGARADEAVMVGDSLEPDVLSPARAGLRAVWFNAKNAPPPPSLRCPMIRNLGELPALLLPLSDGKAHA